MYNVTYVDLAYIDPGTGSVVLQLVIAGVLGSLFFLKTKIKHLVERLRGKKDETEE